MSEKYSTEDLLAVVGHYRDGRTPSFSDEECDAIIARLRAADALVNAVREWASLSISVRKAIADYEGKEGRI